MEPNAITLLSAYVLSVCQSPALHDQFDFDVQLFAL